MQIQVNTNRNIHGDETLSVEVSRTVEGTRYGDLRCLMDARLEGRQPIAVTHRAGTSSQAVEGAADELTRLIESSLGRLRAQHKPIPELSDER